MYSPISGSHLRGYWFLTCEWFAGRHQVTRNQVTRTFERSKCPYSGPTFSVSRSAVVHTDSAWRSCSHGLAYPQIVRCFCWVLWWQQYNRNHNWLHNETFTHEIKSERCGKRTGHRYGWDEEITDSSLLTWMTSLCNPVKTLLFFQKNRKENEKIN